MTTLWCLYNSLDKTQKEDLQTDQVRSILRSMPTSHLKEILVCKKHEMRWQSIVEVPEFYEETKVLREEMKRKILGHSVLPLRPLYEEVVVNGQKHRKAG